MCYCSDTNCSRYVAHSHPIIRSLTNIARHIPNNIITPHNINYIWSAWTYRLNDNIYYLTACHDCIYRHEIIHLMIYLCTLHSFYTGNNFIYIIFIVFIILFARFITRFFTLIIIKMKLIMKNWRLKINNIWNIQF